MQVCTRPTYVLQMYCILKQAHICFLEFLLSGRSIYVYLSVFMSTPKTINDYSCEMKSYNWLNKVLLLFSFSI